MMLNWMDLSSVSINALLLLERVQYSWLEGWDYHSREADFATVLAAYPHIEWFIRHKCPEANAAIDRVLTFKPDRIPEDTRPAELVTLRLFEDLIVYALDPAQYDNQGFLNWDSAELSELVDFNGKTVIDIGAGTGRQSQVALQNGAAVVYAVEPVENLRRFMRARFAGQGCRNFYVVDGLITGIPFADKFADVVMTGHVFGDLPGEELAEMERVLKPGGMIILIPGLNDSEDDWTAARHQKLVNRGFHWACFEEPGDGIKRKYWKRY